MATTTPFELYDILFVDTASYAISATDLDDELQEVINSSDAKAYMMKKYGTRNYNVLLGRTATLSDAAADLHETFRIYISTRQHNINKQYQALFNYDYSPIENVDRYESETTGDTRTNTYGKTIRESGSDALARTGTITDARTGTDATAGSGKDTTTISKSGFNNPNSYTPDEKTEVAKGSTDTTTYNSTDTTTHNDTDTTTYGHTTTDGGSDSETGSGTRTLRVHGNIGVTRSDELLRYELDTRKISLAEFILDDFIDRYTYYA